jgi:S1-C subfamily serine protease
MNRTVWIAVGAGALAVLVILAWAGVIGSLGASVFSVPQLNGSDDGFSPQRLFEDSADSVVLVRSTFGSEAQGTSQSLGSGFMVSKQGHIITNAHVVEEDGAQGAVEVTARRDGVELAPV